MENKECKKCKSGFEVTSDDLAFYGKMGVPAPGLCPECRFKRRAQFRNEMSLYTRKCVLCDKSVVTMYNPKSPYTVYCISCWESDSWDPYSYGRDYDKSRPFFDQFKELTVAVPKKAVALTDIFGPNVNSDYTNVAGSNKNCYLIFNSGLCEDVMYSRGVMGSSDCSDIYFGEKLERCYETVNVSQSSGVVFGQNGNGDIDSIFMLGTSGCQNCFGCVNLRNKRHNFFNEPISKDEYERRMREIRGSYSKMKEFRKKFEKFSLGFPRRENSNIKTVDSTGDYLFECKNVKESFEAARSEDCKYLFSNKAVRNSYDLIGFGHSGNLQLEGVAVGASSKVIACFMVDNSLEVEYSFFMKGGEYCIGCDGLKKARYTILNKRYSKEEYEELKEYIVDELSAKELYGLYMPPELAPFAYNETVAQDNMPLTKEEAVAQGFRWEDDLQMTKGRETMGLEDIPDHIKDVEDGITKDILSCGECGRSYKITAQELGFYRKMVLPVPRKCFFCRHGDRLRRRGPFELYNRECGRCEEAIKTTYTSDRPEIVWCEECYKREVV